MSNKKTSDVTMMYIEDDIKKIQVKTNLFVQEYGPNGVFQLAKEIFQNGIDEAEDPNSSANFIGFTHNRIDDSMTITDNGRGIPEEDYDITIACTKNQAGSKFFRNQGGKSSGEFGVFN